MGSPHLTSMAGTWCISQLTKIMLAFIPLHSIIGIDLDDDKALIQVEYYIYNKGTDTTHRPILILYTKKDVIELKGRIKGLKEEPAEIKKESGSYLVFIFY